MVPPDAAAGDARVCAVRVCAAAENIHPAADTNMAASTASQQIVNRLGTKTPTPEACDLPRHRPLRQVTRPFTNSTIRRWTRSFQVANTINVSTNAKPMRNPYSWAR